jgi:hypothetical protein
MVIETVTSSLVRCENWVWCYLRTLNRHSLFLLSLTICHWQSSNKLFILRISLRTTPCDSERVLPKRTHLLAIWNERTHSSGCSLLVLVSMKCESTRIPDGPNDHAPPWWHIGLWLSPQTTFMIVALFTRHMAERRRLFVSRGDSDFLCLFHKTVVIVTVANCAFRNARFSRCPNNLVEFSMLPAVLQIVLLLNCLL